MNEVFLPVFSTLQPIKNTLKTETEKKKPWGASQQDLSNIDSRMGSFFQQSIWFREYDIRIILRNSQG